MRVEIKTDVLVVGLGPVGDVLAGLLGQSGIATLAIDREPDIHRSPRAAVFDFEVMRTFQRLGIADEVRADTRLGTVYKFVNADGKTLLHFNRGELTASGWAPGYLFHQPTVEGALRNKLRSLPTVDVRVSHQLLDIERNDEKGITATLATASGDTLRVSARYLVACDGGTSTVRKLLGVDLFDYDFEERWLVVDVFMEDEEGLSPHSTQYCDPQRPTTMLPLSPGRRRWEFMLLPGEKSEDMTKDEVIAQLLSKYVDPTKAQIVRKAAYKFHGLIATQWRANSVLLAGDAAHQMPPFLGQGMCSGIRDAVNLAWKLTAILQDEASADLLNTYQMEREPHVRKITETAIKMGRIVCTLDIEAAKQRDMEMLARDSSDESPNSNATRIPKLTGGLLTGTPGTGELLPQPVARVADGREGRLDDLLSNDAWLITRTPFAHSASPSLSIYELGRDITDDGTLVKWLDQHHANAVLVRPDRYVFGTGNPHWLVAQWQAGLIGKHPSLPGKLERRTVANAAR